MSKILEKGANFVWNYARHLERAIFEYNFFNGSSARILEILKTYQNEDGGFGNALEPDVRTPDSQPLFAEFGLRMLHEYNLRDPEMASRLCDFFANHADLKQGIPTVFPSVQNYPHAAHWNNPGAQQPSFDRLAGLVGLVNWQGAQHPWLPEAISACLENVATAKYDDVHTILTTFSLIESVSGEMDVEPLYQKLAHELFEASYFSLEAPSTSYALTPLAFAPYPQSYCRKLFTQEQIEAHLDDLESKQAEDGGWPIQWDPPGEVARWEWRANKTVNALSTLRAYGRI